jgi:hypothetical protein
MTSYAEAQLFVAAAAELIRSVERRVREQMESTARVVAAADEVFLREAIDSVSWERRGFLGRLIPRPR